LKKKAICLVLTIFDYSLIQLQLWCASGCLVTLARVGEAEDAQAYSLSPKAKAMGRSLRQSRLRASVALALRLRRAEEEDRTESTKPKKKPKHQSTDEEKNPARPNTG
jgi:hypothetical protein